MDLRATIDAALGRMDEAAARAQMSAVLEHLGNFIASGDMGLHRAFLHTFLAMRAAEAQSPAAVLAMLVAIGDTAAQVAQEDGAGTAQGAELTLVASGREPRHDLFALAGLVCGGLSGTDLTVRVRTVDKSESRASKARDRHLAA